jgi:lipopolysaccharide export system protein LptC
MPRDGLPAGIEGGEGWTARDRSAARPSRGYTRFVSWMKLVLPGVAVALLLLVAAWPRLEAQIERLGAGLARLDLNEARDLRMVNAHFSGLDKLNRPYTVTAQVARQMPSKDDLVSLEGPKADIALQSGAWVAVNSDTGVYQQQQQVLDLFGQVHVFHDNGIEFITDSARVNLDQGTAEGTESVAGQGGFGEVDAQGFQLLDRGERVIFTGKSRLLLVQQPGGKS